MIFEKKIHMDGTISIATTCAVKGNPLIQVLDNDDLQLSTTIKSPDQIDELIEALKELKNKAY